MKHMRDVLDQVLVEPLDWQPRKRVSLSTRASRGEGMPAHASGPDVPSRRD